MTSTAEGDSGFSFGWINRDLIASGKYCLILMLLEERRDYGLDLKVVSFQFFSAKENLLFMKTGRLLHFLIQIHFNLSHQQIHQLLFGNDITTENYSGTAFKFRIEREVTLLSEKEISKTDLRLDVNGLKYVAYRSDNKHN